MTKISSKPSYQPSNGSKEKLRTIMEAASALTALGDSSDSEGSHGASSEPGEEFEQNVLPSTDIKTEATDVADSSKPVKRYIPNHKKPDAALTFPEKLMNMMKYAEKQEQNDKEYCIAWLPDGKSFVIRNPDAFTRQLLVKFFKATKFSSFTRKLYRWGFRQVNRGLGPDDPVIFGNEFFQRDKEELMVKMRSITAAGTRKANAGDSAEDQQAFLELQSRKRSIEAVIAAEQEQRKRLLLESLLQEKAALGNALEDSEAALLGRSPGLVPSLDQSLNLANSLRASQSLSAGNSFASPSFGFPGVFPKNSLHLMRNNILASNPNTLNLYQAAASSPQALPTSSADIVNAAISALRHAS